MKPLVHMKDDYALQEVETDWEIDEQACKALWESVKPVTECFSSLKEISTSFQEQLSSWSSIHLESSSTSWWYTEKQQIVPLMPVLYSMRDALNATHAHVASVDENTKSVPDIAEDAKAMREQMDEIISILSECLEAAAQQTNSQKISSFEKIIHRIEASPCYPLVKTLLIQLATALLKEANS